ncbi:homologous recombination OB-fold protein [Amia ocellicauda]|uniref:homologous recombination OB-fold protein n=1 Tax=Amia ocellicauda TaxID=2972642 RepID=UPI003463D843
MACRLKELFNVGEEFEDEDDLFLDLDAEIHTATPAADPSFRESVTAPILREPSTANLQPAKNKHPQQQNDISPRLSLSSCLQHSIKDGTRGNSPAPEPSGFQLRPLSKSTIPSGDIPKTVNGDVAHKQQQNLAPPSAGGKEASSTYGIQSLVTAGDEFDDLDWDVSFTDADEAPSQAHGGQPVPTNRLSITHGTVTHQSSPVQPICDSVSPAKKPHISNPTSSSQLGRHLPGPNSENIAPKGTWSPGGQTSCGLDNPSFTRQEFPVSCLTPSLNPIPSTGRNQAPKHLSNLRGVDYSFVAAQSQIVSPVTPRASRPQTPQMSLSFPNARMHGFSGPFPMRPSCLMSSVEASSPVSRGSISPITPRSLQAPVFTNHLVQLVSAANKTPHTPRLNPPQPKTRRFPGPAGLLPKQFSGRNLDDILISPPQTPAHGALAKLQTPVTSSQQSEEEFCRGPWARMKAEMGLDERNPSSFLCSYSVIMVLRKAALKQLAKNKVPNMAVMVKSLTRTNSDARAVFRDPTGEMQGTIHRQLLEERQAELKTGAVLLLKQVGVFSPSHRNHYLNVTPNNLLRIYTPDGTEWTSTHNASNKTSTELEPSASRPQHGPCTMRLIYDDDDDNGSGSKPSGQPCTLQRDESSHPGERAHPDSETKSLDDTQWEADDLDDLMGELSEDSYCF